MVKRDKEMQAQQTPVEDQPQWHAPQLRCFEAKDAENSMMSDVQLDHSDMYHS